MIKDEKAISLVELSVSIVIIGLILGGILGGFSLVKTAQIRKLAQEMTNFHSSLKTFEDSYQYMPGDIPIAEDYWGSTNTNNGNGNGMVDITTNNESLLLWQHLALADIIPGSYTGTEISGSEIYKIDVNVPNSDPYPNAAFVYIENEPSSYIYNTKGLYLRVAELTSGDPDNGMLAAKTAYSLDVKLDDGAAATGMFFTIRSTAGCTDGAYTATSANYVLDDSTKTCILVYWQKKT